MLSCGRRAHPHVSETGSRGGIGSSAAAERRRPGASLSAPALDRATKPVPSLSPVDEWNVSVLPPLPLVELLVLNSKDCTCLICLAEVASANSTPPMWSQFASDDESTIDSICTKSADVKTSES